jgi:hypothetical protein
MRKFTTAAAASLIVATAAPALARDTAPSAPTQSSESPAPKAETRYCVSETPVGTRLPKKTCKTRAQWIADENFDPLAPQR